MNFIKKIVDGKIDKYVHAQFSKLSKGEFRNRAIIVVRMVKNKYKVATTSEFAKELVIAVATKLGDDATNVKGGIITAENLDGLLDYQTKKQFQGVKNYGLDVDMTGTKILELIEKFPKAFFGLTFAAGDTKLKVKSKAPRSPKSGDAPKADFCRLETTDKELGSSFIIEANNFKKAEVNHTYFIEKMIIPEEFKDSKDFAIVRLAAIRAGRIVRKAVIDEKEMERTIEFEA